LINPNNVRAFVGVVSQPSTFTSLELGYVYENGRAHPVQEVELPLWRHNEQGRDAGRGQPRYDGLTLEKLAKMAERVQSNTEITMIEIAIFTEITMPNCC
jgi:hypothetical protein